MNEVHAHDLSSEGEDFDWSKMTDENYIDDANERIRDALNKRDFESWNKHGNTIFAPSGETVPMLPPGLYRCARNNQIGDHLIRQKVTTDDLIEFDSDSDSTKVIQEIESFWDKKDSFESRGLLHKRGILLSGDPGSGKTSIIQILVKKMIDRGGIVLYPTNEPDIVVNMLQAIRRIQPDTPICLLMEDFEVLCRPGSYEENRWLAILDGECQVDNIVYLATTNYIEKIDKRFTDRPSRFDLIVSITMPNRAQRKQYLVAKEKELKGDLLEEWLDKTDGFAVAHLKEMIVSVFCMGHSFEATLDRMEKMRKRKFSSENNRPKNGGGFKAVSRK